MRDGRTHDRAQARGGIDGGLNRLRHASFIFGNGASSKRKVQRAAPSAIYFSSAASIESNCLRSMSVAVPATMWPAMLRRMND
jgi:hypothetical protein